MKVGDIFKYNDHYYHIYSKVGKKCFYTTYGYPDGSAMEHQFIQRAGVPILIDLYDYISQL